MNNIDDLEIEALKRGEEAAFRNLIGRYHNLLLSVVRPLVNEGVAEEVVQESWLKAYQSMHRFAGRSTLKTWLCSIALNEARMYLRSHKRESVLTESDNQTDVFHPRFREDGGWKDPPAGWSVDGPDEALMSDNLIDCISKVISQLPESQAVMLQLRDIEGVPFETICNELSVSASNARVLLHRARKQLYLMLEYYEETGEC